MNEVRITVYGQGKNPFIPNLKCVIGVCDGPRNFTDMNALNYIRSGGDIFKNMPLQVSRYSAWTALRVYLTRCV